MLKILLGIMYLRVTPPYAAKIFLKWKHIKETKINTKEHNNRQNVNRCIRNLETNKEREKANKHF